MAYSAGVTAALMIMIITTLISTSTAEIRSFDIRSEHSSRIIKLHEFGFTNNGRHELNVTNLSFSSSTDAIDLSKLGFILSSYPWPEEYNELDCFALEFYITKQVYNLSSLPKGATSFNHYFKLSHADRYTLVFTNCLPREVKFRVSMNVRSAMYNLNEKSNKHDYLSVGMTILPTIYFSLSLIYLIMVLVWVIVLYNKRFNVLGIHYFMLAVVILKALNMIFEAVDKSNIKHTGTTLGWEHAVLYIIWFLNDITFLPLILLIANCWKPKLEVSDKMFMMIVIILQVIADIALVAIDERGRFAAQYWVKLVYCLAYSLCWSIVVGFLLLSSFLEWSEKSFEGAATTGPKKAFLLMLSKHFRWYPYVFLCYYILRMIFDTLILCELWVGLVVGCEVATLAFYGFTGYSFKPCDAVDDDNDLEAATSQQNMNIL